MSDTIFALATAPGRAAVAIMRISGPGSQQALRSLGVRTIPPRTAALKTLKGPDQHIIDQALVLWFPGPNSFTGEDCVELQVHGGRAVVDALTQALIAAGNRLAEPGEFTRRAFENGKLDLSQAEATADLVDAETAAQAQQAIRQLRGAMSRRYGDWRERLIRLLANLEGALDFPDENLPSDLLDRVEADLGSMINDLDQALVEAARGVRIRDGYRVALIGAPNAGKSTLANALVRRSVAIVSDTAGTTRDVIEAPIGLAGHVVTLADMAGLHASVDDVEKEGVRRALDWSRVADLRLWVIDQAAQDGRWREAAPLVREGDFCVLSKMDLPEGADGSAARRFAEGMGVAVLDVSLSTGVEALRAALVARVSEDLSGSEFPAATRARHVRLLEAARERLREAEKRLSMIDLAAEDIRLAARAMERVTGRVGAEDILDDVFKRFCIGK